MNMNDSLNSFEVQIPSWDEQGTITVTLRRPSLLTMAAQGEIPNELMGAAQRLFGGEPPTALPLDKMGAMLISVAKASLTEPTYDELCKQGGTLTDMQLAAIYSFSQAGVRALLPFRDDAAVAVADGDGKEVQSASQ